LIQLNPNYAPAYSELGMAYEAAGNAAKAAEAFDAYVLLAPNFSDTADIRARAEKLRTPAKRPPTLLRK
jgi:regulator of sirC expression with transglutaminase-like and TPR domain